MKTYILLFLLLSSFPVLAQNDNYVVITPNSASPASGNTLVGPQAGNTNMTGANNAFLGAYAGFVNTTGYYNAFLGAFAGNANMTGNSNSFVGAYAGQRNTSGSSNTFSGHLSGQFNTTGQSNSFFGANTGYKNISGNFNAFFGYDAGHNNTDGDGNVIAGYQAAYDLTVGNYNVALGPGAGIGLVNGSRNVMLGFNTQPTSGSIQNSVAIGANATVALNNAIVLGDPNNISVAVGIGTNAPQFPLDVRGIIRLRSNGTIKFSHLLNPNLRNGTTDQFLTVNEQGETVLARHRLRIDNINQWSDKVFEPTYQLPLLKEVERYVAVHRHLPNVPSAEDVVKDGVDPVKMNATLLEKVEELTLYSIQQEKKTSQQQKEIDELKILVKQLIEKR